jgi:uncharacterized protein YjgD (DUF1641 family)
MLTNKEINLNFKILKNKLQHNIKVIDKLKEQIKKKNKIIKKYQFFLNKSINTELSNNIDDELNDGLNNGLNDELYNELYNEYDDELDIDKTILENKRLIKCNKRLCSIFY